MNTLRFLDQFVSKYCLGTLFFLGIISLLFNTIIFTRRTLRSTSCILYFFASTLANYPIIYFVIPCRFLADGFGIDPTIKSLSFCKFREYILTVTRSLSAWFMLFASFDRFISTSRNIHYRRFCRISIARLLIIVTTITHFLFYIHIPILFTNHLPNDQCEAPIGTYRIINDCLYSIIYIILPALLMLIFGILTIKNQKRRGMLRISQSLYIIKRDRNLFLMFIFQFILFVCTTLPQAIQKLYITITLNDTITDVNQNLFNQFISHAARMISFINHSCQFYIFTLSSKLFRHELKLSFQQLFRIQQRKPIKQATIVMQNNRIHIR